MGEECPKKVTASGELVEVFLCGEGLKKYWKI
jgi:hypothetical protein